MKYKYVFLVLTIASLALLSLSLIWLLGCSLGLTTILWPVKYFWLWWLIDALGYFIAIATLIIASGLLGRVVAGRVPTDILTLRTSMASTATAVLTGSFIVILIASRVLGVSSFRVVASIALVLTLVPLTISWLLTPIIINTTYSARSSTWLQSIVNEVASKAGLRAPKAVLIPVDYPNAFAYSSPLGGSYVAVTEGLIRRVSREELKAVIGHELGHHKHKDVIIMLLLGIVPTFIYFLGRLLLLLGLTGGGERRESRCGGGGTLLLLAIGVGAIAASLLMELGVLAFSRLREYYADAHGAKVTSPKAMIEALRKIHNYYTYRSKAKEVIEHSKIKTLFIYAFTSPFIDLSEILSSHPPIDKRIRFLENISHDITSIKV